MYNKCNKYSKCNKCSTYRSSLGRHTIAITIPKVYENY